MISLTLAVLASISSNKLGDNKPDTFVVAKGIIALSPSDETIVLAPVVPVILKLVDTLVNLALLSVMSLACCVVIVVVLPASASPAPVPTTTKVGKFDISEE